VGGSEIVITRFQLFPEIDVIRVFMALHIRVGHAERIDADLHIRLTKHQRAGNELENLVNALVGHGIAAYRHTGTVNHQIFTFIAVSTVIGIRETDINRFIKAAVRL